MITKASEEAHSNAQSPSNFYGYPARDCECNKVLGRRKDNDSRGGSSTNNEDEHYAYQPG